MMFLLLLTLQKFLRMPTTSVLISVALDLVTKAACHSNEAMKKIVSLILFYQHPVFFSAEFCPLLYLWHICTIVFVNRYNTLPQCTYTYMHTQFLYMCVCGGGFAWCVCVCEGGRERDGGRDTERVSVSVCWCVLLPWFSGKVPSAAGHLPAPAWCCSRLHQSHTWLPVGRTNHQNLSQERRKAVTLPLSGQWGLMTVIDVYTLSLWSQRIVARDSCNLFLDSVSCMLMMINIYVSITMISVSSSGEN